MTNNNTLYPKIIQIEVSTCCNFDCTMCSRKGTEYHTLDISLELFQKIAQEAFPHLDKVVLYGMGEPLMHPKFVELVRIARQYLPPEGKIEFTTNASLLTPDLVNKILPFKINRIVVSLDTSNITKLKKIRQGSNDLVLDHLTYLSKKRKENHLTQLAIETVAMRSNLHDFTDLIYYCHELSIDSIFISHVVPFHEELQAEMLYITPTLESWTKSREILEKSWHHFIDLITSPTYTRNSQGDPEKMLNNALSIIEKTKEEGIELNLPQTLENYKSQAIIDETIHIFKKLTELAKVYKIYLDLPEIFPEKKNRQCPYNHREAIIINVLGQVVPCFNLLHPHKLYLNNHVKEENPIYYGDLTKTTVQNIYNSPRYLKLRNYLSNLNEQGEWCGDCVFSSSNCFYVNSNEYDCLGITPNCNECLYSMGIAKCVF